MRTFRTKRPVASWLLAGLLMGGLLALPQTASGQGLESQLPEGTLAYAAIPDATAALKAFNQSDLGLMCADPSVQAFIQALSAGVQDPLNELRAQFKEEVGMELDEVLKLTVQQAGVALIDIDVDQMAANDMRRSAWYDMQDIVYGAEQYQMSTGQWPKKLEDLMMDPGVENWSGPYLWQDEAPVDPWGNPYSFTQSETGIVVRSLGADGQPGGEGPAADFDTEKRPQSAMPVDVVAWVELRDGTEQIASQLLQKVIGLNLPEDAYTVVDADGLKGWNIESPDGAFFVAFRGSTLFVGTSDLARSWAATPADGTKLVANESVKGFLPRITAGANLAHLYVDVQGILAKVPPPPDEVMTILDETGVLGLEAIGFGLGVVDGKVTGRMALDAPAPRKGIVELLAFKGSGTGVTEVAGMIPATATDFSLSHVSLGQWYDTIYAIAEKVVPPGEFGEFTEQLAQVEESIGFSIRQDLLGAFGSLAAGYTQYPQGGGLLQEGVMMFQLADEAKFNKLLDALAQTKIELKSMEYQGQTLRYLSTPLGQLGDTDGLEEQLNSAGAAAILFNLSGLAFYVQDGWLIVSNMAQSLKTHLDWQSSNGAALAGDALFQGVAAATPQDAGLFAYGNGKDSFQLFYNSALPLLQAFEGFMRAFGVPAEFALLPRGHELAQHLKPSASFAASDDQGITFQLQVSSPTTAGAVVVLAGAGLGFAMVMPARSSTKAEVTMAEDRAASSPEFTLEDIYFAQLDYQVDNGKYAADLGVLGQAGYLSMEKASGVYQGYQYTLAVTDKGFEVVAVALDDPKAPHLKINHEGVMFERWPGETEWYKR